MEGRARVLPERALFLEYQAHRSNQQQFPPSEKILPC